MKSLLKSLLKKILFRTQEAKNFPPVRIKEEEIIERVFLKKDNAKLEISDHHCIACHAPFCIAVSLTKEESMTFKADNLQALFLTGERVSAILTLSFRQSHSIANKYIIVFEATNAGCFQTNPIHQFFIRRYFKNKNTILEDKMYGAAYSFPRKVIAVSYKDKDYYTIFPMDFQCLIKKSNIYILGLRTTNITLAKILNTKKLVISDTNAADVEDIYFLGKHHSTTPPSIDKLPFLITESEVLKFPVPDFAETYNEVEIVENHKLGSHMLLIGKVINEKTSHNPLSSLYHIHFLQSLSTNYKL